MLVRISGSRDAKVEPPFMVFMIKDRNYHIKGTPDNHPRVAYRTGPKGWMDIGVMPEWMSVKSIIRALSNGRHVVLFFDDCSGHNNTEALNTATKNIRAKIRYFPANAAHLV